MRIVSIALVVATLAGCSRHSFERFFTSGERFLSAKQYAEAAIEFENAIRANPQSVDAQMKLGDSYVALGQTANAAAAYQRACALDPKTAKMVIGEAPKRRSRAVTSFPLFPSVLDRIVTAWTIPITRLTVYLPPSCAECGRDLCRGSCL